jgi:hypothetical protein
MRLPPTSSDRPKIVCVRGFIFDADIGLLREMQPIAKQTAA